MKWLFDQWNDIKGNAKWTAVLLLLTALTTAAVTITRGLATWQQITLALCFLATIAWAVFATVGWLQKSDGKSSTTRESELPSDDPLVVQMRYIKVDQNNNLNGIFLANDGEQSAYDV
jgi:hypothetical protein